MSGPRGVVLHGAAALALAACGFQATGATGDDQPPDDARPGDAPPMTADDAAPVDPDAPAAVTCWPRWLAGTPTVSNTRALSAVNSSGYDRDPSLSHDGLALYWSSDRSPSQNGDIWVATRATTADAFGSPTRSTALSSANAETRISFTADGLTAALGSSRTGSEGGIDIFLATRATTALEFTGFSNALVMDVNSSDQQHDPFLSGDGLRLYFAPTTNGQHIEVASRATVAAAFGAPVSLIDSGDGDADPSLSPDERVIVFASRRTGSQGADIWFATRASVNDPFGAPVQLDAANSADDDGDPGLSADGCTLYFSSTRSGGAGGFDLYAADVAP